MPRRTPEEYEELGRRYYKLKQYDAAMKAFTNGIDLCPSPSLYNHRAAIYDKLEDYNAAVKDGREMIKLDKKDVKGYLRTASLLEKMEKLDVALGIYKYGMKNVPVEDKNFELLQQLHDKITRKLSPAKSVDPLTVLPVELVEMVLEYLSFKHIVSSTRVSKGWRDYLVKLPRVWLHLDLSAARKPVSRSFVDKAIRRSQNRLTKLTVHRFEHADVLKNITKACKDLAEVDLVTWPHTMCATLVDIVKCAPNLKKLNVRSDISSDTMTRILHYRPNLEQAEFGGVWSSRHEPDVQGPFPNLTVLTMKFDTSGTVQRNPGKNILRQAPALQSLTYCQPRLDLRSIELGPISRSPLTSLILKQKKLFDGPEPFPSTLRTLVIQASSIEVYINPHLGLAALNVSRLPCLEHFTLEHMDALSPCTIKRSLDYYVEKPGAHEPDYDNIIPVKDATPLKSLRLGGALQLRRTRLFKHGDSIFGNSPRILTPALKSLDIKGLPCNDDDIEHLVGYETGLTFINLSQTNITGASLMMLADKLPTLKKINADNCSKIDGRAAVDYAINRGISVSFIMEEPKIKGKRY